MWAWRFAKMQEAARAHGWTPFVSMQDQYNLVQREEEREMFGLLADEGVGSLPWSPLAAGLVARPWGERSTTRGALNPEVDQHGRPLYLASDQATVEAVQRIAADRDVAMATVAMAWVLRHPVVDAPIIGATKPHHLADAVAALDVELTDDEVTALEEHYTPREPHLLLSGRSGSGSRTSPAVVAISATTAIGSSAMGTCPQPGSAATRTLRGRCSTRRDCRRSSTRSRDPKATATGYSERGVSLEVAPARGRERRLEARALRQRPDGRAGLRCRHARRPPVALAEDHDAGHAPADEAAQQPAGTLREPPRHRETDLRVARGAVTPQPGG